jgi:signal transduction histidine kinase
MIQIAIHELKSPLELASDYIQLTMNNMKVDDNLNGQQFLKQANIHVRKANSFVADTKDAALFESEEIQFRFDHFDIKACLSEIVSIFRQTFGDYQFIMNTLEQPVIIYGDEARISRVITNFIANAIKYSSGQKTIEISIVNAEPEIQIDVKDYGIGITKDEHEKIFKKNDGIHADGKQHHTGHGLYIASKIMLRHLGKIGVKNSSPGNGSTFWIKLPQVKELIF